MKHRTFRLIPALLASAVVLPLIAQDAQAEKRGEKKEAQVFTLGQISVTARKQKSESAGTTSTLDREQLNDFTRDGLPEALDLIPGVSMTAGSGSRNESTISIRGFDRYQTMLMMDGIRLYLPADGRLDFDRFLTPDLAEVQVSKGYVSVLNGPGGMGGVVNLVTRKPVKEFEGEARASMLLANKGQSNGYTIYGNVGGRYDKFYYQASAEARDIERWRLSNDFTPTSAENGGVRDHTSKKDTRLNLKLGFTPNATDEYSLNYVTQSGDKHGVGAVNGSSAISTWDWPEWDTSSLYWASTTQLGGKSYLKTRAYYNTFVNTLHAYSDTSLANTSWISYYDDSAVGGLLEFGTKLLPKHDLKVALHYRRDEHVEWQDMVSYLEPKQTCKEDTASLAIEDTWQLTQNFKLIGGLSRDARLAKEAQDYNTLVSGGPRVLFDYKTTNDYATNYQAAGILSYSKTGKLQASVSSKTRFPSLFERYSSRFGGATSNPFLKAERAVNYDASISDKLLPWLRGEAALFYSKVSDAIQSVNVLYSGKTYSQSQNVGKATYQGVELSFTAMPSEKLEFGGNYTYVDTDVDNPVNPTAKLTGVPNHKFFVYAKWQPTESWTVVPTAEYGGQRPYQASSSNPYYNLGGYTIYSLKVEYKILNNWDVSVAARNLGDKNYQLSEGYPQEGRNFVVSSRFKF